VTIRRGYFFHYKTDERESPKTRIQSIEIKCSLKQTLQGTIFRRPFGLISLLATMTCIVLFNYLFFASRNVRVFVLWSMILQMRKYPHNPSNVLHSRKKHTILGLKIAAMLSPRYQINCMVWTNAKWLRNTYYDIAMHGCHFRCINIFWLIPYNKRTNILSFIEYFYYCLFPISYAFS